MHEHEKRVLRRPHKLGVSVDGVMCIRVLDFITKVPEERPGLDGQVQQLRLAAVSGACSRLGLCKLIRLV